MRLAIIRVAACLAVAAMPASAFAAAKPSPIDGTWKSDLSTAKLPARPDVMLLKDGSFTCSSCIPAYTVPADGQFHAVAGHSYWDETSVTAVDANTVSYAYKRKGKQVSTSKDVVSADGNTLTSSYERTDAANGTSVSGTATETRVAAAPSGAHLVSGSWRTTAIGDTTDAAKVQTFAVVGRNLTMSTPTGESYNAKIDGAYVPITGDPGGTMVAVKRLNARSYEETGKRDGKPVYSMVFTVSADGQTLSIVSTDLRTNAQTKVTATKQ